MTAEITLPLNRFVHFTVHFDQIWSHCLSVWLSLLQTNVRLILGQQPPPGSPHITSLKCPSGVGGRGCIYVYGSRTCDHVKTWRVKNPYTHTFAHVSAKSQPSAAHCTPQSLHPNKPVMVLLSASCSVPTCSILTSIASYFKLPGSPSENHSCVPRPVSVTLLLCSCRELGASRRLQLRQIHCSGRGPGSAPRRDTGRNTSLLGWKPV